MHCFLFQFTLVLNSVHLFFKLLVFEFFLGTSETSLCSVSATEVKIIPMLDALQPLILFAGTLTNSEPKIFPSIIFYNGPCIRLNTNYTQHVYMYPFSPHNGITTANVHI
jgi:hypothetical protein